MSAARARAVEQSFAGLPDELHRIAKMRHTQDQGYPTSRPISTDRRLPYLYNLIGVEGEAAFVDEFAGLGAELETRNRPKGDGGIDFNLGGLSIDIKTALLLCLGGLVEEGKTRADVFVFAQYQPDPSLPLDLKPFMRPRGKRGRVPIFKTHGLTYLVGWAWREEVERYRARDWGGHGIISHKVPIRALRPIEALRFEIS